MNLNQIQERINKLLSFFVTEVKGATAMGRADINHVSEVVLVPLLSKVFGYSNLANLNQTEKVNYPAVDLGDLVARIAFQVTSTSNSTKVKKTLEKFVSHELYKKYDRLIIYNLAEKQDSYTGEGFEDIIQGRFDFDKDRDIIDYTDVLKKVSFFQVDEALDILRMLEANFSAGDFLVFDTPDRVARRKELIDKYLRLLKEWVGKVRILGDPNRHDLTEVFIELTVLKDRERPSSRTRAEYWEVMDAELRERRDPFAGFRRGGPQIGMADRKVRPEELLKAGMRAVVAGAPGGGKSTLMNYLALKAMGDEDCLPVFLELNTINEADFTAAKGNLAKLVFSKSLAETVCESEIDRALLRAEFYKKLRAGRAAIFLDGLDEVSGTGFFDELRLSVKEFLRHGSYQGSRLYISSRPYALLDYFGPEEAQEFEILPLDPGQIEKFVGHYYGDDPQAAAFLGELRRRFDLREMASVPALLGFLFILYRTPGGGVPKDRLELYRLVVRKLAGEWDKEKQAKRAFQTTDARRIAFLGHLAFSRLFDAAGATPARRFIFTGQEIFTEAERYCISRGISAQADALADEVTATALLRQVGADAYAFTHLTLQEYMAATTLLGQANRTETFCRAYFDQTLSEMEVLPMFLGLAGHQPELHDALKALPESIDHKQLRLRARSLAYGAAPDWLSVELGDRLDARIRGKEEIEYGYFDLVVRAFSAAAGSAVEAIARRVASRLAHDEPEYVRSYAVQAAGIIGSEAAFGALRLALQDPDASVRVEAASRLASKDEQAALDVLTHELGSGDDDIKDKVIYALWNLGSERAVKALEKAAESYPVVRKRALEALASIREEEAVPILAGYLNDPDGWVRSIVVESLGEIGGASVIPHLIKAADDGDIDIAEKAVEFLGRIGGEEVIRYVTGLLENRSGKLLGSAAEALGQAGAAGSVPKLAELLEKYKIKDADDDFPSRLLGGWMKGYVRAKIAGAICQLGDERGRDALVEAITKGYSEERKEAAKALARCRPDEAKALLPEVIGKLQTANDLAKYELAALADILYDLDACDDPRVITAMINVLNNSHGWHDSTATVAMNVLGHVGGRPAIDALTKAAEHHDPMRQLSAMTALGNIADENTVAGLLDGLTTGVNPVSQYAARGLSRVDGAALYIGLKNAARHEYPKVRRKVARCIFYYSHDEEGVELISELAVNDPHEKIKEAARQAMDQLERKRTLFE
ncbi:MAG: HEAT repeat domain-containing protein [Acidobacteria bacterium]|nr:HEAT repeat domain-containing protein [Acidobacteriota bacterium]